MANRIGPTAVIIDPQPRKGMEGAGFTFQEQDGVAVKEPLLWDTEILGTENTTETAERMKIVTNKFTDNYLLFTF